MTIKEILSSVACVVGSYSEASFRRDCSRLKIKPLGTARSVPRHYPPETPALIVQSRGFETALLPMLPNSLPPMATISGGSARLVTISKLKAVRRTSRKVKGAR